MRFLTILFVMLTAALGARAQSLIMDTASDTRPFHAQMKEQGVRVVGRYYSRCKQDFVAEKRLVDNVAGGRFAKSEADMLLEGGFAILSIYQYYNNSALKFDGKGRHGGKQIDLPGADCRPASGERSAAEEARLDANAAVAQARKLGQPQGSAIYFGVDFDLPASAAERETVTRKMIAYFTEARKILSLAGYRIGSYGSGYANRTLQEAGLVDHTWLSPSPAHRGSVDYYRSGKWTLFQARTDLRWFARSKGTCGGLPVDTNLRNPAAGQQAGFWTRKGPFALEPIYNVLAMDALRFICDGHAVIRNQGGAEQAVRRCVNSRQIDNSVLRHGTAVFVDRRAKGDLVQVDMDHDGLFDVFTGRGNLSSDFRARPKFTRNSGARCP